MLIQKKIWKSVNNPFCIKMSRHGHIVVASNDSLLIYNLILSSGKIDFEYYGRIEFDFGKNESYDDFDQWISKESVKQIKSFEISTSVEGYLPLMSVLLSNGLFLIFEMYPNPINYQTVQLPDKIVINMSGFDLKLNVNDQYNKWFQEKSLVTSLIRGFCFYQSDKNDEAGSVILAITSDLSVTLWRLTNTNYEIMFANISFVDISSYSADVDVSLVTLVKDSNDVLSILLCRGFMLIRLVLRKEAENDQESSLPLLPSLYAYQLQTAHQWTLDEGCPVQEMKVSVSSRKNIAVVVCVCGMDIFLFDIYRTNVCVPYKLHRLHDTNITSLLLLETETTVTDSQSEVLTLTLMTSSMSGATYFWTCNTTSLNEECMGMYEINMLHKLCVTSGVYKNVGVCSDALGLVLVSLTSVSPRRGNSKEVQTNLNLSRHHMIMEAFFNPLVMKQCEYSFVYSHNHTVTLSSNKDILNCHHVWMNKYIQTCINDGITVNVSLISVAALYLHCLQKSKEKHTCSALTQSSSVVNHKSATSTGAGERQQSLSTQTQSNHKSSSFSSKTHQSMKIPILKAMNTNIWELHSPTSSSASTHAQSSDSSLNLSIDFLDSLIIAALTYCASDINGDIEMPDSISNNNSLLCEHESSSSGDPGAGVIHALTPAGWTLLTSLSEGKCIKCITFIIVKTTVNHFNNNSCVCVGR